MSNALSFLLVLAVGAVVWLARGQRAAQARIVALEAELATGAAEKKEIQRRLESDQQARRKQAEELAELRRRSDKARRRVEKAPELPLGPAARIREVEVELERARATIQRIEGERDERARRAEALAHERAELAKRIDDASAPARADAEANRAALERARAELAALREQCQKQGEELSLARQTEARMRKRMDNQEQLYASLRAELEVKKDRLRAQEERIQRLQALEVAITSTP